MSYNKLYGQVNKPVSTPQYSGGTTDSLQITVDPKTRVITGNVIWDTALGELAHRAYPGDKGARNYGMILELTARLNEEIRTATANRTQIEGTVALIEKTTEENIQKLTTVVEAEEQRARSAENAILANITAEVARSQKEQQELLKMLNDEVQNRTDIDEELRTIITTLAQQSSESIQKLQQLITDESATRDQADKLLDKKLTAVQEAEVVTNDKIEAAVTSIRSVATDVEILEGICKQLSEKTSKNLTRFMELDKQLDALSNKVDENDSKTTALIEEVKEDHTKLTSEVEALSETVNLDNRRIDDLQLSVSATTASILKVQSKHETDIETLQRIQAELSEAIQSSDSNDGAQGQRITQLQAAITAIDEALAAEEKVRAEETDGLNDQLAIEVKRSTEKDKEHSTAIDNNSKRITDLQNNVADSLETLGNKVDAEDNRLLKLIISNADELARIEKEAVSRDSSIETIATESVTKVNQDSIARDKALKEELSVAITIVDKNSESRDAAIEDDYTRKLELMDDQQNSVASQLQTTLFNEMRQVDTQARERDREIDSRLSKDLRDTEAELETTIDDVNTSLSDSIKKLEIKHDKELSQLDSELTTALKDVDNSLSSEIRSLETDTNKKINKVANDATQQRAEMQATLQKSISDVDKNSQKRDNELLALITGEIGQLNYVPVIQEEGVYAQQEGKPVILPVSAECAPDVIVRRDDAGAILVPALEEATYGAAITESHVEAALSDLYIKVIADVEEMLKFDFVDAGTAPIELN